MTLDTGGTERLNIKPRAQSSRTRRTGRRLLQITHNIRGLLGIVAFLAIWQLIVSMGVVSQTFLPSPIDVGIAYRDTLQDGILVHNIVKSLQRILAGYAIGVAIGMLLGIITGVSKFMQGLLAPLLEVIRPIPPIAWIPLAVLWFGIGDVPAIFIVALTTVFVVYVTMADAISSIDRRYFNAARTLGATRWMILKDVSAKAILPQIITALRVGLGNAWIAVVAAELIGARAGLGYMIQLNQQLLKTDVVMVGMSTIGIIGFLMNLVMVQLQRIATPWDKG